MPAWKAESMSKACGGSIPLSSAKRVMKIPFTKAGEGLVCQKCKTLLPEADSSFSDDGAVEDYWCENCVDFVGVRVVKLEKD